MCEIDEESQEKDQKSKESKKVTSEESDKNDKFRKKKKFVLSISIHYINPIYVILLIKILVTAECQMNVLRWRKLICPIHILD